MAQGNPDALIFWLAVLERRLGLWERIEGLAHWRRQAFK
jgi:hypothetical protein